MLFWTCKLVRGNSTTGTVRRIRAAGFQNRQGINPRFAMRGEVPRLLQAHQVAIDGGSFVVLRIGWRTVHMYYEFG